MNFKFSFILFFCVGCTLGLDVIGLLNMVLQNYLPQVITVLKDIHDNDSSAGAQVAKLFADLTPGDMKFMKSAVQSIVDGKIQSIENAVKQAEILAKSIERDEVNPFEHSNEQKEMEPNILLKNTTKTAKQLINELKPIGKQVNNIISLAVSAIVHAKYVGSTKSRVILPKNFNEIIEETAQEISKFNDKAEKNIKILSDDLQVIEKHLPSLKSSSYGDDATKKYVLMEKTFINISTQLNDTQQFITDVVRNYRKTKNKQTSQREIPFTEIVSKFVEPVINAIIGYVATGNIAPNAEPHLLSLSNVL